MSKFFSFDIGHSSIGWAAFDSTNHKCPELEGCGTLLFPADDCLAIERRTFRRQRRNIRSRRMRISRIKRLLEKIDVLSRSELDRPGGSMPWKLAAQVLCGYRLLDWNELWDVLRWYAHNRGYDGNRKWSRGDDTDPKDTEKEEKAKELMERFNAATMAEAICAQLHIDPKSISKITPSRAYKTLNAAFPRAIVVNEVRDILQKHKDHLLGVDDRLIEVLCAEDNTVADGNKVRNYLKDLGWDEQLPGRYVGGLLFGQSVPRFDNRIIGECPISGQKKPLKTSQEFREYRWAMQLANIRIPGTSGENRPLSVDERKSLTNSLRDKGAFSASVFKHEVERVTGNERGNAEAMMTHPDAADALVLDPPKHFVQTNKLVKSIWNDLPNKLQNRILGRLNHQKRVTWGWIAEQDETPKDFVLKVVSTANEQRRKNIAEVSWDIQSRKIMQPRWTSGRAPYSRSVMRRAVEQVMQGCDPRSEGGVLYITEELKANEREREIDSLTNNHVIRHRLRMLERLVKDMIKRYAGGDASKVTGCAVEVIRDLVEFSGKTQKDIKKEIGSRLKNFKDVQKKMEEDLSSLDVQVNASLIRKGRIAADLNWTCPYTQQKFDAPDLVFKNVDREHIIPRSLRPTDSLDSLVITYREVNQWKGNRTARQFVMEEQGKNVPGKPELSVITLSEYDKFVERLAGEERPTRFSRGTENLDDKMRKWKRKQLLKKDSADGLGFTPRDLTITSHLAKLACRQLEILLPETHRVGSILSIPGTVTGVVRKAWKCLGCLASAAPRITKEIKVKNDSGDTMSRTVVLPKGEIRAITQLHHALDAVVLGYIALLLPADGKLWEQLIRERVDGPDFERFKTKYGWNPMLKLRGRSKRSNSKELQLLDLPKSIKESISVRLQENRVVKHVPSDMSGAHLELNAWRVVETDGDRVVIQQKTFLPKNNNPETGARNRTLKTEKVSSRSLVGLQSGKLHDLKSALVIKDNYGVAILESPTDDLPARFEVIRFHQVKKQLQQLTKDNNGVPPDIIRNGQIIRVASGNYEGVWRVFSVKDAGAGVQLAIGPPDTVVPKGIEGCRMNASLASIVNGGLTVAVGDFTGYQ